MYLTWHSCIWQPCTCSCRPAQMWFIQMNDSNVCNCVQQPAGVYVVHNLPHALLLLLDYSRGRSCERRSRQQTPWRRHQFWCQASPASHRQTDSPFYPPANPLRCTVLSDPKSSHPQTIPILNVSWYRSFCRLLIISLPFSEPLLVQQYPFWGGVTISAHSIPDEAKSLIYIMAL